MNKTSEYPTDKNVIATYAFANCVMILRNAISMPDSYIEKYYGSDEGMLKVAEKYYDFGLKILSTMPPITVSHITMESQVHEGEEDE